jgi:hypothetical protein
MQSFDERKPPRLWHPQGLLGQIARMELEQVAAAFEHAYFLIIRLDEFSSGLGAGLKAAENQGHPRVSGSIYPAPASMYPPSPDFVTKLTPPRPGSELALEQTDGQVDYPPDLLQAECHVVRIRKRTWQTSSPAVTVGRAPEQDIPLQHPSVSKLHATLEFDGNELYVTDVGSLNRTFVNGEPITSRTRLRAGDSLKFGAVRCAICSPQGLWRALHSQRAAGA